MGNVAITIPANSVNSIEEMKAQIAAFEANPVAPDAPNTPELTPTATSKTIEPQVTPPPATPPKEDTTQADQRPKEATEKKATETPKAAEPVKVVNWEARYKGLQSAIDKERAKKEAAPVEKQAVTPPTEANILSEATPEFREQLAKDLEKDPIEALIKLQRSIVRQEMMPLKSKLEREEARLQESARMESLDRLVKEGHEWLKTEDGIRKMEAVFAENRELWNTKDPYRAALGFISDIPRQEQQRGQAQAAGLTPILGASSAVPPVVTTPAVSNENRMEELAEQYKTALSRGLRSEASKIMAEMDKLHRGY